MYRTVDEFVQVWSGEFEATQKIFKHLNDAGLSQAVVPGGRTLGFLAWHIVMNIVETMTKTGLPVTHPGDPETPPKKAREIFDAYNKAAEECLDGVRSHWTDATLQVEDEMFGERWKRGESLQALVFHQIHHRGQMTVLMRQAGLRVPGVYGPSREQWAAMGMKAPL